MVDQIICSIHSSHIPPHPLQEYNTTDDREHDERYPEAHTRQSRDHRISSVRDGLQRIQGRRHGAVHCLIPREQLPEIHVRSIELYEECCKEASNDATESREGEV